PERLGIRTGPLVRILSAVARRADDAVRRALGALVQRRRLHLALRGGQRRAPLPAAAADPAGGGREPLRVGPRGLRAGLRIRHLGVVVLHSRRGVVHRRGGGVTFTLLYLHAALR